MFPYIVPILNMVLILLLKQCLVLFDVVMGMTTGGPCSRTESLSVYIYKKAFETLQVGYATSVAVTVFFIMIIIAVVQLNLLNKKDVSLRDERRKSGPRDRPRLPAPRRPAGDVPAATCCWSCPSSPC